YWNRKKKYSIQLQGIVNYRGIFIDYEIGWSSSVHDAKVYKIHIFIEIFLKLLKEKNIYLETRHILYLLF
ncbi:hypothetical protein RhiirB3_342861, partial [Rhizophagus irregularis]